MPPEVLKLLYDVEKACGLIEQFTAEKTAEDFRQDVQLRSAVERQFIIIGEALQSALRLLPDLGNSITDTRRIISFRNIIVHGYAQIVSDTVWGVIEKDLPVLHCEITRLVTSGLSP